MQSWFLRVTEGTGCDFFFFAGKAGDMRSWKCRKHRGRIILRGEIRGICKLTTKCLTAHLTSCKETNMLKYPHIAWQTCSQELSVEADMAVEKAWRELWEADMVVWFWKCNRNNEHVSLHIITVRKQGLSTSTACFTQWDGRQLKRREVKWCAVAVRHSPFLFAVSRERKQAEKEGEGTGRMGFKVVRRDAPHTFVTEEEIKLSEGITAPHYFCTSQYNLLSSCDKKSSTHWRKYIM